MAASQRGDTRKDLWHTVQNWHWSTARGYPGPNTLLCQAHSSFTFSLWGQPPASCCTVRGQASLHSLEVNAPYSLEAEGLTHELTSQVSGHR